MPAKRVAPFIHRWSGGAIASSLVAAASSRNRAAARAVRNDVPRGNGSGG